MLCRAPADVFIAEFDANNVGTATDTDGNAPDWIELRNSGAAPVNLNGWGLSDDPEDPGKWPFPEVSIEGGEQLLVFASKKDRSVARIQLHANFRLSWTGSVVLSAPDGHGGWRIVHAVLGYPRQRPGTSYGFASSSPAGRCGYFPAPTPRSVNPETVVTAFAKETKCDLKRGFYDAPFALTITTATLGATIAYTTDGSEPTETHRAQTPAASLSERGRALLGITGTTTLRACAYRSGLGRSEVDTHTYIFSGSMHLSRICTG